MTAAHLFATTFAVTVGAMIVLWLISLATRDVSIVDVYWGPGFALSSLIS